MLPEASRAKSTDKLVYMANQIGKFFAGQGPDIAVSGTAEHIKKFWDPRMRAAIFAHLQGGGAGLDPPVRQAIANLQKAAAKA
jgi:formate dehydrogenase subunit delta